MAVCGRCLICGHKFSCGGEDEAIRWTCEECPPSLGETREHAICRSCHRHLADGTEMARRVEDLLALVRISEEED